MTRRVRPIATVMLLATALTLSALPAIAAVPGVPDLLTPAKRDTEPVVLTGASFGNWAAPADVSAKVPALGGLQCLADDASPTCTRSRYEEPEVTTGGKLGSGVPVDHLLGYRWNGRRFVQIPFQVDEIAVRYLSNNASGFAAYSETDAHPTYVWDEERFRWSASAPGDPCRAVPLEGVRSTPDPVAGLDMNDEVAFMASDAGDTAPRKAQLPRGVLEMKRVRIVDPYRPRAARFVYVARTAKSGPQPAFDARTGYVRYEPDADSDTFVYSQSSYGDYGNAAKGAYLDAATGRCITDPAKAKQRRPKDTAWIRTSRYAFRYDGRWLMTQLKIAKSRTPWQYGPDLIDQWKARAFQQRPGGTTPCCGYEDEDVNWGGSSITMGVRSGPVRVIRATWGADSGTNVVRVETFYRSEIRQTAYLRVHPIPPLDGIYAQWDYNAGKVTTYYNPIVPKGVAIDGRNDEVFGNINAHVGPDGLRLDGQEVGAPGHGDCGDSPLEEACVDNDIDLADPTLSGAHGGLNYEEVTGPYGTLVTRTWIKQYTPGNVHTLVAQPYYRDDSCFDDGTGTDPGVHLKPRSTDPLVDAAGRKRVCWTPQDGDPALAARDHYFQGSIATQGVHVQLIVDTDNAFTTVPLTELSTEQRIVVLPGQRPNVGEQYGRGVEKPLVAVVL